MFPLRSPMAAHQRPLFQRFSAGFVAKTALASCVLAAASLFVPREQLAAPLQRETPRSIQGTTTSQGPDVSILVYHRVGPAVKDAMTVRTVTFRWQLDYLKQHRHPIIPLRTLISYLLGNAPAPLAGAVVITADDGHQSVFTDMLPIVREYDAKRCGWLTADDPPTSSLTAERVSTPEVLPRMILAVRFRERW